MSDPQPRLPDLEEKLRFVIGWTFVIVLFVLALAGLGWWLIVDWNAPYLVKKLDDEFNVIIGIPASAAAALLLVISLRTTDGRIELEALAFKFKGASGPIMLWVMVFLSIILAIKTLSK